MVHAGTQTAALGFGGNTPGHTLEKQNWMMELQGYDGNCGQYGTKHGNIRYNISV